MDTTDFIGVNKKYKDRLFRLLFSDRKNALNLYNGLNGSDYLDEDEK